MLVGCALLSALVAGGVVDGRAAPVFVGSVALVLVALAVTAYTLSSRTPSLRFVIVSPFTVAAATWLLLFVLRPLELYAAPEEAALGLAQFGFGLEDLTRTTALGAAGCATWCVGYLLGLGVPDVNTRSQPVTLPFRARGAAACLAIGTALWFLLFLRQGGFEALFESAASIREGLTSSFWGFVGIWIVQGVALCAAVALLRTPTRAAGVVLALATLSSLAAAVAVQMRMLFAFAGLSVGALVVLSRPIRRHHALVGGVTLVVGVLVLAFAQQVRQYSAAVSTEEAVRLAARTPLSTILVSDLATFDHFVAMHQLVPASVEPLDGQTLVEIPGAWVPRSLWTDKPLGIDFQVSSYLYPGVEVAVPISLQGELYWNGGLAAVLLGSLVVGACLGALARFGLRAPPLSVPGVLYAIALPFTHAFLTRGLATMTQNLIFAVTGVAIALVATAWTRRAQT